MSLLPHPIGGFLFGPLNDSARTSIDVHVLSFYLLLPLFRSSFVGGRLEDQSPQGSLCQVSWEGGY